MIGRFVSDLEVGDVLPSVEYTLTPLVTGEYCHGVELSDDRFFGPSPGHPRLAPPTMVHVDKLRVLDRACPGGPGPAARMQLEYDAQHFAPVEVGTALTVRGEVVERSERNGRERLVLVFEVRNRDTGALLTRLRDTSLLNFTPRNDQ